MAGRRVVLGRFANGRKEWKDSLGLLLGALGSASPMAPSLPPSKTARAVWGDGSMLAVWAGVPLEV
jgi:hypothetical protein